MASYTYINNLPNSITLLPPTSYTDAFPNTIGPGASSVSTVPYNNVQLDPYAKTWSFSLVPGTHHIAYDNKILATYVVGQSTVVFFPITVVYENKLPVAINNVPVNLTLLSSATGPSGTRASVPVPSFGSVVLNADFDTVRAQVQGYGTVSWPLTLTPGNYNLLVDRAPWAQYSVAATPSSPLKVTFQSLL